MKLFPRNSVRSITRYSLFTFCFSLILLTLTACKNTKQEAVDDTPQLVGPTFSGDTALAFCAEQCVFGPRVMNSTAHDKCEQWIISKFKQYGCDVKTQKADLKGWDGEMLHSTNIIATITPKGYPSTDGATKGDSDTTGLSASATENGSSTSATGNGSGSEELGSSANGAILICAHWDCRPWADNDPDSTNWHKPVMAANDAASGVAVMLELARIINAERNHVSGGASTRDSDTVATGAASLPTITFVCFDAEDYGTPQWSDKDDENSWALGAQYYAQHLNDLYPDGNAPVEGILLDMVGGQGAHFYQEGLSMHYASDIMQNVWSAANSAGFGSFFINQQGGTITDDHKPLNEAGLPTIDIIPYYPDCEASGFGPTWHTVSDDMQHLDKDVLKAVGQTLVQYLYSK